MPPIPMSTNNSEGVKETPAVSAEVLYRIGELEKKLKEIRHENFNVKIVRLNAMFEERLNELLKLLDKKADKDELQNLEDRLNSIISDIVINFDRYPDREDVLRALMVLEENVRLQSSNI
jgi:hypothetical protein